MKRTSWLLLLFILFLGSEIGTAKPSPPALTILAYDTGQGVLLLSGHDRTRLYGAEKCAEKISGRAGVWLIDKNGAIEHVTLAPMDQPAPTKKASPQYRVKHKNIQSYYLNHHVWQKVLAPLDYNSLELRKKIVGHIVAAGGEDCAPCLGLYGSGSYDLNGDKRTETVYVVETDEWVGVFVEFAAGKWIKVDGHATAAADALELAGPGGDPAKLWHHTYEVLCVVDPDYDGNLELVVRENRYREQAISLVAVTPAGAKILAKLVVKTQ